MTTEKFRIPPKQQNDTGIKCSKKNPDGIGFTAVVSVRRSDFFWGIATAFILGIFIGGFLVAGVIRNFVGR